MPDEKGLGSKLLGLFVEVPDKEKGDEGASTPDGEKSAAEIVAELAGGTAPKKGAAPPPPPPAPAKSAPAPVHAAVPKPTGAVTPATVDFDAVFKNAGVDAGELDRVRKAEELLKALPEATPAEVKRQIVEASLKAFGIDLSKIGTAAQNQLKALDTFVRINEQQTAKSITDAQAQIAQLEDKIITLRADIEKRTNTLAATAAAADVRKDQVRKVLEFFIPPAATP